MPRADGKKATDTAKSSDTEEPPKKAKKKKAKAESPSDSEEDFLAEEKPTKKGKKSEPAKRRASNKATPKNSGKRTSTSSNKSAVGSRDYWIEYYDGIQQKWICVDPVSGAVDDPSVIEKEAVKPFLWVIGVDNDFGVRDLAARYCSQYLTTQFRRQRGDLEWWNETLDLSYFKANARRARLEDAEIRNNLLSVPLPTSLAEFKNHPLYVLEKDLLKYEAIYPRDIQRVGEIRGQDIFPRTAVYNLQGELNWFKEGRSVRKGEEPYKVVKARPKFKIPKEQRVPLTLKVYGYWQTEPYEPPEVVDGKIARNDHGNIYMYQESMLPKGCVHLRLPGIFQISRKLNLEAVPAIVGWEFSGGGNHPTIDGCVVLEEDAETLRHAWIETSRNKASKEKDKAQERIWKNWKKIIKGKLLLEKMRDRFN